MQKEMNITINVQKINKHFGILKITMIEEENEFEFRYF